MSVKSVLENKNVQLLISKFDLEMPKIEKNQKYTLQIADYEITPEGVIAIHEVNVIKNSDGSFVKKADLGLLYDQLPYWNLEFVPQSEVTDENNPDGK